MKSFTLVLSFLVIIITAGCNQPDLPEPDELRYFDRIVLTNASLSSWDLLSGPDIFFSFGENSYASSSSVITNVSSSDLPLTWTFSSDARITDENWLFKLTDEDDFGDEVMFETNFDGYQSTKTGNPFYLSSPNYTIEIYWKTK